MDDQPSVAAAIEQIAPRLRRARQHRAVSLAELARATGISTSTLSRLESGQRKPSLELLLPVTAALGLRLDAIVSAPRVVTPVVPQHETRADGRVIVPLSQQQRGPRAYKLTIPVEDFEPRLRVHDGYEWLYVLRGRLRVILGEHESVLRPGEVAEFECRTPHWFGAAAGADVEVLSIFGKQGERLHVRARTRRRAAG